MKWERIDTRKAWTNGRVTIVKPQGKNTFDIVDRTDNTCKIVPRRFTTLPAAKKYADAL